MKFHDTSFYLLLNYSSIPPTKVCILSSLCCYPLIILCTIFRYSFFTFHYTSFQRLSLLELLQFLEVIPPEVYDPTPRASRSSELTIYLEGNGNVYLDTYTNYKNHERKYVKESIQRTRTDRLNTLLKRLSKRSWSN